MLSDMGMMINRRRAYGGKSLPYDAEIEYLVSTGSQYIDTGITDIWDGLVVTLDISVIDDTGERDFFGSRNPASGYNYAGCFRNLNKDFVLQIGNPYVRYGRNNDSGRHIHIYDAVNKTCSFDNYITSASNLTWRGSGNDTFKLFQRVHSNGRIKSPSSNKLFATQFVKDGVLVRDYIPVRIGNVGYMYDKVSKQLFGNAGTGDFILGPDKGTKNINININVRTRSTGDYDASLDVITGDGEPVNIFYRTITDASWTNGYIQVKYLENVGWRLFAITSCLYDGQVYESGYLIAAWSYTETKDISLVANYEEIL